mgnify:CR=1 FL=1
MHLTIKKGKNMNNIVNNLITIIDKYKNKNKKKKKKKIIVSSLLLTIITPILLSIIVILFEEQINDFLEEKKIFEPKQ